MPGSDFDRLSHGRCSRHEARHLPRLRLAPPRPHARSQVAVAELGVVRRLQRTQITEIIKQNPKHMKQLASISISLLLFQAAVYSQIVADTIADFSIAAQGTNGFQYGLYTSPNSTTGTFSISNFVVSGSSWVNAADSFGTPALDANGQHPGVDTLDPAVRRYTIGSSGEPVYTGLVNITGQFFDRAPGPTSGFITVNGVNLFNQDVPNTGNSSGFVSFDLTVAVAPGSTIDFGVNAGTDAFSDSTGLKATVTIVPEPSTLNLLLILAPAALLLLRRRAENETSQSA